MAMAGQKRCNMQRTWDHHNPFMPTNLVSKQVTVGRMNVSDHGAKYMRAQ